MAMPVVEVLKYFSTGWEIYTVLSPVPNPPITAAYSFSLAIPWLPSDSAIKLLIPSIWGWEAPAGPAAALYPFQPSAVCEVLIE